MGNLEKLRIVIIDEEEKWRNCLAVLLGEASGFCCVGAFSSVDDVLRNIPLVRPEIVVLGLEDSPSGLLSALQRLKSTPRDSELRVIIFSTRLEPASLCSLLAARADALVNKSDSPLKLVEAVEAIRRGDAFISTSITRLMIDSLSKTEGWHRELDGLSERELEVLRLLATGSTDHLMAATMGISVRTVSTHLQHIYEKLDVHTRSAAVAKYLVSSASDNHRVWRMQKPSQTAGGSRSKARPPLVAS